jgi:hypothetical protein
LFVCANCPGYVPPSEIEVIGNTTIPVFVTVTTLPALVFPRAKLPKDRLVGETAKAATTSVPDSETVFVPAPLPAAIDTVAVFGPALVGLNFTVIVQTLETASDVPQLLVCENWDGLVPPTAIEVIGKAAVPVFVTNTVFATAVTPTAIFPNAMLVGDMEKARLPDVKSRD